MLSFLGRGLLLLRRRETSRGGERQPPRDDEPAVRAAPPDTKQKRRTTNRAEKKTHGELGYKRSESVQHSTRNQRGRGRSHYTLVSFFSASR